MKHLSIAGYIFFSMLTIQIISCNIKKNMPTREAIAALQLKRGDMVFCGPTEQQLGRVEFKLPGSEKVRKNFNLALSFLIRKQGFFMPQRSMLLQILETSLLVIKKKAGPILNTLYPGEPDHPGIVQTKHIQQLYFGAVVYAEADREKQHQ